MYKIELTIDKFIAKGGERYIYLHPSDDKKIIKIVFAKNKHNNQNKLDYMYCKFLENKKVDFSHITRCSELIQTNLGMGLVCEKVENYDKSRIRTLSHCARFRLLDNKLMLSLIEELKEYLFKNEILFVDASLSNVFCKKIDKNKYKLIIFDGLGARRTGFKFWLYTNFKFVRNYKIKKQWNVFMKNYYIEYSLDEN
jgi:hypothetical protein